jgi:hypothetical protein
MTNGSDEIILPDRKSKTNSGQRMFAMKSATNRTSPRPPKWSCPISSSLGFAVSGTK